MQNTLKDRQLAVLVHLDPLKRLTNGMYSPIPRQCFDTGTNGGEGV